MAEKQRFDSALSMYVREPVEPDQNHLAFQRWLIAHGRQESSLVETPPPPSMTELVFNKIASFHNADAVDLTLVKQALEHDYDAKSIAVFIRQLDDLGAFPTTTQWETRATALSIRTALSQIAHEAEEEAKV